MNDAVMAQAIAALHEGVRENELVGLINREHLSRGADQEGPQLVAFGPNGVDPHHAVDGTVLKSGDSVILDMFTPNGRYWCDMTRTVFYKTVSEKQREVYELVRRANAAAIAEARPGVPLSHLDATARGVIEAGGYGPYFTHRLGHGCGLDCHEPPDVSGASHGLLEPGMVFSVEPGIYLPGEFGVRIEDLVLVTETGCEVLNHYPKDLQVIE
jgi:Xaa-Pro dipeptidase